MKQKIIFIKGRKVPQLSDIQKEINDGFIVKNVYPQPLISKGDSVYAEYGGWICILEKEGINL